MVFSRELYVLTSGMGMIILGETPYARKKIDLAIRSG
jgi:hypothetical protein